MTGKIGGLNYSYRRDFANRTGEIVAVEAANPY